MANTDSLETMEIGIATDVGCVRELNEDTVLGQVFVEGTQSPWHISALIAVADGMGGHQGGEVASQLAGKTVQEIFASEMPTLAESELVGQKLLMNLAESVRQINQVVHQNGVGVGISRSGTTLTLCLIRPQEYCIGHVGDSRAYLIQHDAIEQVTQDDSYVGEMVRRGQMTEEEAQQSEFRNRITKAIGLQAEVEPSVYYGQWKAGDVLLLCSDGLSEYVRAPELLSLIQENNSLQQVCDRCIQLAKERGGHDNISVVAARSGVPASALIQPLHKPETWPPSGMSEKTASKIQKKVKRNLRKGDKRKSRPIAWDKQKIRILALILAVILTLALIASYQFRKTPLPKPAKISAREQQILDKINKAREVSFESQKNITPKSGLETPVPDVSSSKGNKTSRKKPDSVKENRAVTVRDDPPQEVKIKDERIEKPTRKAKKAHLSRHLMPPPAVTKPPVSRAPESKENSSQKTKGTNQDNDVKDSEEPKISLPLEPKPEEKDQLNSSQKKKEVDQPLPPNSDKNETKTSPGNPQSSP